MREKILESPAIPSAFDVARDELVYHHILREGQRHLDSIFMIDVVSGEKFRVDFLISQSKIVAAHLQALGCKSGDVVGILCENRCEYFVILLGILRAGATAACFNYMYSVGELEHTLNITKPFIVFTNAEVFRQLNRIKPSFKTYKYIIQLDPLSVDSSSISYRDFIENREGYEIVETNNGSNHPAIILFSSGSTGLPKGVMLSNEGLTHIANYLCFIRDITDAEKEIVLSVIPLFHGYGVLIMLQAILWGSTIINLKKFDKKLFLSSIERYKVTSLSLVPPLAIFLAKHPLVDEYNLSSLSKVACGAAPLSVNLENALKKRLKLPKIIKGYGLTETTMVITTTYISDDKPGSVGKLLPGMRAKIADLVTGEALGPNQEGEICLKGRLIMKGYYNNEEETKKAFDKDEWFHTGDVGYYDEDGDFFIVDRIKDLIKYKGFQVAPAELESLLLHHKAISDVAVVGIPDEIAGEVPKAFVVRRENISEKEIMNYISEKVAPHMKLRGGVAFVNEIPRNPNGKILRRVLRAQIKAKL